MNTIDKRKWEVKVRREEEGVMCGTMAKETGT